MLIKNQFYKYNKQRGISIVSLIFVLAVVGMLALVGLKVVPTFAEYRAAVTAIKDAKGVSSSVRDAQISFDKSANANYIESISGKDLIVSRETGEIEISFAYEKKIPLFGPLSLVIDYTASTLKNGAAAGKAAANQ